FTNFVGCVLTHQLPFQTYLATYFLFVDVALVSQYYYYSRRKPPQDFPPLSENFPYAQGSAIHHPPYVHPRKASKTRRGRPGRSKSYNHLPRSSSAHTIAAAEDQMRASWMSENTSSARSTAATTPNLVPHTRENSNAAFLPSNLSSTSLYNSDASREEPPSPSIPERGRTLTRFAGAGGTLTQTFDPTLATIYGSPSGDQLGSYPVHTAQTRLPHHHVSFNPATTTTTSEHRAPVQDPHHEAHHMTRGSSSRSRPPPPSRRGTGIAFLSVGLLFTIGTLTSGGGSGAGSLTTRGGGNAGEAWRVRVPTGPDSIVKPRDRFVSLERQLRYPTMFVESSSRSTKRSIYPLDVSVEISSITTMSAANDSRSDEPSSPRDDTTGGTDWERVIGRVSAWLCTTAYLTSRLPQIWRNFRRRSVEGLAMTLFLFAFIGNSLYVASILTNPFSKTEPGYLVESLPYLLGSGGTLCFDLMIMFQAVIYSEKRRLRKESHHHHRQREGKKDRNGLDSAEEEAALLNHDHDEESEDLERQLARTRTRSRDSDVGYNSRSSSRKTVSKLYMTRSRSTEMVRGNHHNASSRSRTRQPNDQLFDDETDHHEHEDLGRVVPPKTRSGHSSRTTSSSSISRIGSIPETG
ncbi:PQ-loop repeat-containing protein, partial [Sporobolomyces koalae]|uniref:PQ-loop repeat-containing protein n=1 Tax=Sporobolomyces koalae TaxID=500713 RepID=UPI00316BF5B4